MTCDLFQYRDELEKLENLETTGMMERNCNKVRIKKKKNTEKNIKIRTIPQYQSGRGTLKATTDWEVRIFEVESNITRLNMDSSKSHVPRAHFISPALLPIYRDLNLKPSKPLNFLRKRTTHQR